VLLALVVGDHDAFPFAFEEARLADDTVRSMDHKRLFPSELEFGSDRWIVHDIGELVSRLQLEDIDGTHVPAMSAPGALLQLHNDFDHGWFPGPDQAKG
jgi:hypothetical protein